MCRKCRATQLGEVMDTVFAFFIAGFFTAFGWWAATKVTTEIDTHIEQAE
jgi:hypothetical protein